MCGLIPLFFSDFAVAQSGALTITADRTSVKAGEDIHFRLDSNRQPSYCGIRIEYQGTSDPPTLIRMNHQGNEFPHVFSKTFHSTGTVRVTATGAKVSSALGCIGNASVVVEVSEEQKTTPGEDTFESVRTEAVSGDVVAMNLLANHLAIRGDDREALIWFERAAQAGSAQAMNSAGYMYQEGRGSPQDHAAAIRMFEKSMKLGNPHAMRNLGLLYFKGLGVQPNKSLAYVYFSLAATNAKDKALREEIALERDAMAKELTLPELAESQKEARRLADQIQ